MHTFIAFFIMLLVAMLSVSLVDELSATPITARSDSLHAPMQDTFRKKGR